MVNDRTMANKNCIVWHVDHYICIISAEFDYLLCNNFQDTIDIDKASI